MSSYTHIADLYDSYVTTTFDIPYWQNAASQSSGDILELMCGTGRVTLPLLEAGYTVTCLDNSAELLAVLHQKLHQKNLHANVIQADVREFDLQKQFNLILIPFNAFAELLTRDDQMQTLHTLHRHLSDTGRLICTLHNPPIRLKTVDGHLRLINKFPLPDGKLLFWIHQQYDEAAQIVNVMQFYEEYDPTDTLRLKRMQELRFSIIPYSTFESMAQAAGFRVESLYGDYSNTPFDEFNQPFHDLDTCPVKHLTSAGFLIGRVAKPETRPEIQFD